MSSECNQDGVGGEEFASTGRGGMWAHTELFGDIDATAWLTVVGWRFGFLKVKNGARSILRLISSGSWISFLRISNDQSVPQ